MVSKVMVVGKLKSVRVHFSAGSKALRGAHAVTRHNWHD